MNETVEIILEKGIKKPVPLNEDCIFGLVNPILVGTYDIEYKEGIKLLKKLDNLYYKDGSSPISDNDYDRLKTIILNKMDQKEYDFIPGEDLEGEETFQHPDKILSLDKVNDLNELEERIRKLLPCIIEPKYDGMTGVAYYINNNSIIFATRGNGDIGVDITSSVLDMNKFNTNALTFINKPIRFEIFMRRSVLKEINKQRKLEGLDLFKNTRNATAGIIRSGDKELLKKLDFVAYNILDTVISESDQLNLLYRNKIYVPDPNVCMKVNTEEDIPKAIEFINNFDRSKLDYDIDGLVIKANYENSFELCGGCTEHHPKNAFAWKFETEGKWTKLKDIKYQVGRTGRITPVAIIEPLELYGTTVTKATLHHTGYIKTFGITENSELKITKANEIIPSVLQSKSEHNSKTIELPTHCPVCGSQLQEINDKLYCVNASCKNKLLYLINHLASKDCLNIEDLAESTIDKLIEKGYIKTFTDIFNITKDELMTLDGFKARKASKLASNISKATNKVPLDKFIYAAGIENVGRRASKAIALEMRTLTEFILDLKNNCPRIRQIKSIGDKIADNLYVNRNRFGSLFRYIDPLEMTLPKNKKSNNNSKEIHFCVTGSLEYFTRDEFVSNVTNQYDNVCFDSSITKNTDYLVIGSKVGANKLNKAQKYGIDTITPDKFMSMLKTQLEA